MPSIHTGPINEMARANLKRIREERGVSQRELSERLSKLGHPILASGIGRIEQGARRLDVDDLVALSIALSVSPLQLLLPPERRSDSRISLTDAVDVTTQVAWAWMLGDWVGAWSEAPAWVSFDSNSQLPSGVSLADYASNLRRALERIEEARRDGHVEVMQYVAEDINRTSTKLWEILRYEVSLRAHIKEHGHFPGVVEDERGAEEMRVLVKDAEELLARADSLLLGLGYVFTRPEMGGLSG